MEYQEFNGIRFYQSTPKDYFRHIEGGTSILMHRYVWEYYNGEIPEGCDIHHIDRNRANNDISNLQLLPRQEHKALHARLLTPEQRAWRRNNLNTVARPEANKWHGSAEGVAWHKQQYERTKEALHQVVEKPCLNCNKLFSGEIKAKFCSNACKSAYRRRSGVDLIEQTCVICGNTFKTDKNRKGKTCSPHCRSVLNQQNRKKKKQGVVDSTNKGTPPLIY